MDEICLLMCAMRVAQTEQIGARTGECQYWRVSILIAAQLFGRPLFRFRQKACVAALMNCESESLEKFFRSEIRVRESVRTQPLIRVGVVLLFMRGSLCVAHIHGQGVSERDRGKELFERKPLCERILMKCKHGSSRQWRRRRSHLMQRLKLEHKWRFITSLLRLGWLHCCQ
jgi:hypothetical protein